MEQKAFDLIAEKVSTVLSEQGFAKAQDAEEEQGPAAVFTNESTAYSVLYENDSKRYHLRVCGMTEEGPDKKWKILSTWAFDPESDSAAYATSIGEDFAETLGGSSRKEIVRQQKKKKKKDEDSSTDPQFFFNRLAGIFPELRAEMVQEKTVYGELRNVTFAREHVLPKMEQLARNYPGTEPFKKLSNILNDLYENGDMDVRSIITIVLLNGISDAKALESLEQNFSEDLAKVYSKSKQLKGKKVKPEKKRKKSKYNQEMMKTLKDMQ